MTCHDISKDWLHDICLSVDFINQELRVLWDVAIFKKIEKTEKIEKVEKSNISIFGFFWARKQFVEDEEIKKLKKHKSGTAIRLYRECEKPFS